MPRPSGRSRRSHQYGGKTYRDLLARLAANVRRLRSARGWTQEEAAHQCGMTTAFFQSVEGEGTNPTGTTLARLADGLHADVSELLRETEPLPPRRPGRPSKRRERPEDASEAPPATDGEPASRGTEVPKGLREDGALSTSPTLPKSG